MTEEHRIQNEIRLALSPYCVIFRINVGKGYTPDGRYFDTGVPKGFSDLFGFRKSDGKAVFIEVKTPTGKPSQEQLKYFNNEGYASPTEYEAINRIQREETKKKYRPLVYICSPFSHGDVKENVRNARRYCRYAVEHHAIPFAPHLLFPQFMNDSNPAERSLAMLMNRVMLGKCDELWIFGSLISKGMKREIKWAKRKKINIRYISVKKG